MIPRRLVEQSPLNRQPNPHSTGTFRIMKTVILTACAALFALGWATQEPQHPQGDNFDNSKLLPLIGDWEGKAALGPTPESTSSIKGTKALTRWIKLDLKFTAEGIGPIEAVAYLCSDSEGVVQGHFFASMANEALFGKGKVEGKKLTILANSMKGEDALTFTFDMSVADELKFSAVEGEGEDMRLTGSYKRKK